MRMIIHGKHLEITEAIRSYAENKVSKVEKWFDHITEVDITLSAAHLKTGDYHTADVLVYANGHKIKAGSTSTDLYAAIDKVVDILEAQITKHKEKIRDNNHMGAVRKVKYNRETKVVEKESVRKIVETNLLAKPMEIEEAILQLEVMNQSFYVFMNSETEELNVVYKRRDGDYGHIVKGW